MSDIKRTIIPHSDGKGYTEHYEITAPEGKRPADVLFPDFYERRRKGLCPTCGAEIGPFRDELSRREFAISGMCQECQDKVFCDVEEDDSVSCRALDNTSQGDCCECADVDCPFQF